MADLKISALTASSTPLAGTEVLPIVQSSTTKQVSVANLTAGRAVSMQSITANNTGLATPVGNFESGDQAGSRIAVINSGAGGQTYHLVTGNPGVSNSGFALYDSTNSATRLYVGSSTGDLTLNTGNLVIGTSGKGIDFSATSGTGTSELLADYEEGTFTCTLKGSVSDPTTPVTSTCNYTKVGRLVQFQIKFVNVNTTGASGNISFAGLPFTSSNSDNHMVTAGTFQGATFSNNVGAFVGGNATTVQLYSFVSNSAWSAITHNAGAGAYFWVSGVYFV